MSEELESSVAEGMDPVSVSLALSGASRAKADAFLDEQRHHLREQFKQIGMKAWELRLGVFLRIATLVVGLSVAAGAGLMVWDAAHSRGLIIEPFSVPPSLIDRGLSGDVIASQLIDRLTRMTKTESSRAVQSYANNWGDNIKVEIPETGVSIGEMRRFLTDWLGHDIRITGEVYRTADGIAVTARTTGDAGATFTGQESDLDALVQQAAEHVYEFTQPYRYANYLDRNYDPKGMDQRVARATAIYKRLIAGDDPVERAWAWNGLGTIQFRYYGNNRRSAEYYRRALAQVPDFTIAYFALAARNAPLDDEEEELQNQRRASELLHRDVIPDLNPHYIPYARLQSDAVVALLTGDYAAAVPLARQGAELPDDFSVLARASFVQVGMMAMIRRHDPAAVRAWLRELGLSQFNSSVSRVTYDQERQDWRDVLAIEAAARKRLVDATNGTLPARESLAVNQATILDPYRAFFALAHAELGDFTAAEAVIAPAPDDNDGALRARAQIAELRGQHARADWWFARAQTHAPSIPVTDMLWGRALLARGRADAATEKFEYANKLGPKFADPLEGWGEALMAQKHPDLALEKFAAADKYAPNWGRLHLKWGEALIYAGKPDDAKAQFARAARLDLTASEQAEFLKKP